MPFCAWLPHWFFLLAALSVTLPPSGSSDFKTLGPPSITNSSAAGRLDMEIPFRLVGGYLIEVEGRIGEQEHLKFILDTGSSVSTVDRRLARRLQLEPNSAKVTLSFNQCLKWKSATVPNVQFGAVRRNNVSVLVGDLGSYSEYVSNVDAVIGMDLLRESNITVDFGARKLIFRHAPPRAASVRGDPLADFLFLDLRVQGATLHLLVDTGIEHIVLYEERLGSRIPHVSTLGGVKYARWGSRLRVKEVTLPGVVFAKRNREMSVLLVQSPPDGALPNVDGVVGIRALDAQIVHLNFLTKTLSWE